MHLTGIKPPIWVCTWPGIKPTATFWCMGQYFNLLSHSGQGINALFSVQCGGKIKRRKAEIRQNSSYLSWCPPLHLSDCASVFFSASVSSSTAMYLVPCQFLCILILVFRLAMLIPVWCESVPAYVWSLSAPVCLFASECVCVCLILYLRVCACVLLCLQHCKSVTFIAVGGCLCLSVSVFNALPHKNG